MQIHWQFFKEGSKTGELIREKLNGLETKTFSFKN